MNINIKKWHISKYDLIMFFYFLLTLFFVYHTSFFVLIPHYTIFLFLLIIVCSFLLIISNYKYIKKDRKKFLVFLLIYVFLIIFRNGEIRNGHYLLILFYLYILGSCYILSFTNKWHNIALNIMKFYIIQHIIGTFFCALFPQFYYSNIMVLFPEYKAELLYQFNHHQIAGITNHYSKNVLYLASGLLIFVPSLLYKKDKKISDYILPSLNFIAILLTGKRSQIIYIIISLLILFIYLNREHKKKLIIRLLSITFITIVSLFVVSRAFPSILSSFERGYTTLTSGNFLGQNRRNLYNLAITEFKNNPIIGIGWDNYKYSYNINVINKERDYMNTHSIYLQILCEVGIIGTLYIIVILLWLLVTPFKDLKKGKSSNNYIMPFISYHIFFLLEGILGNSLYDIQTYTPYLIMLSMYMYSHYRIKEDIKKVDSNE